MTESRVTIIDGEDPPRDALRPSRAGLLAAGVVVVAVAGLALFGFSNGPDPTLDALPPPAATETETTATTLSPETLTAREYEADVELVNQLWRDETTAWAGGFDSGLQFRVDNNYPDMECRIDDYVASRFTDGRIEGLQIERIANASTIELDEGWIIPGGKLEGVSARGRVYVMSVMDSLSAPGYPQAPPTTRDLHVTILDGRAHFFFGCPV